jgi:hypothetical protein
MKRRNFLKIGGAVTAGSAVVGIQAHDENKQDSARQIGVIPRVENGQILTSKMINDMIDRINELQARLG